jgi:hypothetical protein
MLGFFNNPTNHYDLSMSRHAKRTHDTNRNNMEQNKIVMIRGTGNDGSSSATSSSSRFTTTLVRDERTTSFQNHNVGNIVLSSTTTTTGMTTNHDIPQIEPSNDHNVTTQDTGTSADTTDTTLDILDLPQSEAHQTITDPNHKLPKWITNYFEWHASMRAKFPGDQILSHPDAPPVLIRKCALTQCGGLHDRLGQLPMDLFIANQTQRMLFIVWLKPYSLENFLVPPDASLEGNEYSFNWKMPSYEKYGTKCEKRKMCAIRLMSLPQLDGNTRAYRKDNVPSKSLDQLIDESIYNLTEGVYKDEKAVTFEILGHLKERVLEEKLRKLGETDMIHDTPSFGKIFLSFFAPNYKVQAIIDKIRNDLGLVSQQYTSVHCRVRHPFGYRPGTKFNGRYAGKADRDIPEFGGEWKDTMVGSAIQAIRCAATIDAKDKMYFMSDMSDLVDYMAFNLSDPQYISSHLEWFENENSANATAKGLVSRYKVVAREQNTPNLHIDKAEMANVEDYYATFVDLFLGIHSKCVSYGIGFYAAFAAKISGTKCVVKYAYEKYGGNKEKVKAEDQGIRCNHRLAFKM